MTSLFNTYLYSPLLHLLEFLYRNFSFGDIGIAVVILTILVRIVLFPLFYKGAKDQAIMNKIAPRLREIQAKHKDNKEKQVQETMAIYKEHKVNPFSQFLLLLVQLPILIAVFRIFSVGIKTIPDLNPYFLGIIDLTQKNLYIVILAAVLQYFQSKLMLPKNDKPPKELAVADKVNRQMVFIGPVITLLIFSSLPSVISLYWLTFSVFSVIQQIIINKKIYSESYGAIRNDDKKNN